MNEQITVHVASHGAKRAQEHSPNLIMYYVDPVTEKRATRSAGTSDRRQAELAAAVWQDELRSGRYKPASRLLWSEFRERYEQEHLANLAEATQDAAASAMNHFERVSNPKRLASISSALMSSFQSKLRNEGMRDTTLNAHLRHLQAGFGWAVKMGMLPKVPEMHKPKRAKGKKLMRGRPITAEEFDRMIDSTRKVRPLDAETWTGYLTGLWLSGLRLAESLVLSWDPDSSFFVDLSGKHPRFRIYAEAEKGNRDRLLPITPDFAEWLLQTPQEHRHGRVFRIVGLNTGKPITDKRVTKILTRIGKRAGVVVNRETRKVKQNVIDPGSGEPTGKTRLVEQQVTKYASAHDLRRAFGTRWAPRVKPATLQLLMRHGAIETTLKYYVAQDADDVAAELWRAQGSINTFINSAPDAPPHSGEDAPAEKSKRVPR